MRITKFWLTGVAILMMSFAAVGCGGGSAQDGASGGGQVDSLLIGTAGEGGTNYFVGQGIAAVIENNTDLSATSQRTAGGTENARRITSGDMDVGIVAPADVESTLEDGTVDPSEVRILMSGHATAIHVAVREDSDYESMDELFAEGRRIGVGEPGSAVQPLASDVLALYDLTFEDIAAQELAQDQQATALQNSTIAGAVLGGGVPLSAASQVGTEVGVRILPFTDEALEEYQELQPGNFRYVIPGGTYEGTPDDVQTSAFPSTLLVSADLPDDVVYEVAKTIHENTGGIEDVHPAGAEWTTENAFRATDYYTDEDRAGLEFHPGAVRWYEEQGVWSEEYE